MTPSESFLERVTLTPASDGLVAVTVLLPPDQISGYINFLESLSSFFSTVNPKIKSDHLTDTAEALAVRQEEAHRRRDTYNSRLIASFDAYTLAGLDRREAVKRICADLRAVDHPWRSFDLVASQLVKLGRGGRSGRPRRVQP
jgi:hypothetical protein